MDISKFKINENDTLMSAIALIEENHQRCVFIANQDDKIMGVVSQGDILRNLIDGVESYTIVSKIANTNFVYLHERNMHKALEIFKRVNLSVIPIIDDNFKLIDVITMNQIIEHMENLQKSKEVL